MWKKILKMMGILFVSIILGAALLIGVYALPTHEMKRNVARSSEIYNYEGVYPQIVNGYKSTQLDNYTDTIMLAHAIYPGSGNIVQDAMKVYSIGYKNLSAPLSLTSFANNVDAETFIGEYPRYWHGYLVFLKPLLLLFDFGDIRMLNMLCQGMGILYIIILLVERNLKRFAIAFGMAILLINPMVTALALQYTALFYIILFIFIFMLKTHNKWQPDKKSWYYCILFLIIGILSAYLDFLTYPLATLGLPLALFWVLERDEEYSWRKQMKLLVLFAGCWCIGYVGMWGGKIVIGSLLTGDNLFRDTLLRIKMRSSSNVDHETSVGMIEILFRSLKVILKWPYVIFFGATGIYFIWDIWKGEKTLYWKGQKMLPYCLIMLLPIIHMMVARNHVYWHYWFTYRELAVTLFAGYCMLLTCLRGRQKKIYKDNN